MYRKWFAIAALTLAAIVLLSLSSCARPQQLVGITVTPTGSTITIAFGEVVGTQFTAYGTYIHPPATRDVTKTAVWTTDTPAIIAVDPTTAGLINTTGSGCGKNLGITATVKTSSSGNIVIGSATMDVTFGTNSNCP
jgi:hypothetical protein